MILNLFKKKCGRDILVINNPNNWSHEDILAFAKNKIDILGWSNPFGGYMTPFHNKNLCFIASQYDMMKSLYKAGQRVFWMGLNDLHLSKYGLNIFKVISDVIEECAEFFRKNKMVYARCGFYFPRWQNFLYSDYSKFLEHMDKIESMCKNDFCKSNWLIMNNSVYKQRDVFLHAITIQGINYIPSENIHIEYPINKFSLLNKKQLKPWRKKLHISPPDREDLLVSGAKGSKTLSDIGQRYFS